MEQSRNRSVKLELEVSTMARFFPHPRLLLVASAFVPVLSWGQMLETPNRDLNDAVLDVQQSILTESNIASAGIESASALERWIDHQDYNDITEGIQRAYQYRNPTLAKQELESRVAESRTTQKDWSYWLDASLLARSIGEFEEALTCLDKAIACPECVDSPNIRVLRGFTLLDLQEIDQAEIEYASAVILASQTNDPGILFRVRQMYADDLYDHGYHDKGVTRGYLCKESGFPLEKAWAHALEIVYLWSKDQVLDVSQTVSDLSALMPGVSYDETSEWERNRYNQTAGLLDVAQGALADDPLSKMILDVEATEFHYKRGELEQAFSRLEHWMNSYPTSEHDTFSADEKEWSLWAKYNYCLMLCAKLRLDEAEEMLAELLAVIPEDEDEQLKAMLWCVLGQTYSLKEEPRKAKEAYEAGLDLDASGNLTIPAGVSDLRSQPFIAGGKMSEGLRAAFVREYQGILSKGGN